MGVVGAKISVHARFASFNSFTAIVSSARSSPVITAYVLKSSTQCFSAANSGIAFRAKNSLE